MIARILPCPLFVDLISFVFGEEARDGLAAQLGVFEDADLFSVGVHVELLVVDLVGLNLEVIHVSHQAYNVIGLQRQIQLIDPS